MANDASISENYQWEYLLETITFNPLIVYLEKTGDDKCPYFENMFVFVKFLHYVTAFRSLHGDNFLGFVYIEWFHESVDKKFWWVKERFLVFKFLLKNEKRVVCWKYENTLAKTGKNYSMFQEIKYKYSWRFWYREILTKTIKLSNLSFNISPLYSGSNSLALQSKRHQFSHSYT